MSFRTAKHETADRGPPVTFDYEAITREALTEPGKIHERYTAFWEYSIGNSWYAAQQLGRIEPIGTYPHWQNVGRQVKKGEGAIFLLMPIMVKDKTSEDNKKRIFVSKKNWFGLHQTQPIEGMDYTPSIPGFDIDKAATELNIRIEDFQSQDGNTQGYAKVAQRTIAVSPIAFAPIKTKGHEIFHVILDHTQDMPKGQKECEAELSTYLLMTTLGHKDGLEYSRGYIQHYLDDSTKEKIRFGTVYRAVDDVLKAGRIVPENEMANRPPLPAKPVNHLEP